MSRSAAPSSDVTTPMRRGSTGSGRLRPASNSPSACSRRLSCSNAACSAPSPSGSSASQTSWYSPLTSYTLSRPRATTCMPSSGLNFSCARRRAEHHRADLRVVVFQREVDVPRAPLLAVRDLALDREAGKAALDDLFEPRRSSLTETARSRARSGPSSKGRSSRSSIVLTLTHGGGERDQRLRYLARTGSAG